MCAQMCHSSPALCQWNNQWVSHTLSFPLVSSIIELKVSSHVCFFPPFQFIWNLTSLSCMWRVIHTFVLFSQKPLQPDMGHNSLANFQIEKKIGRGQFSEVYRARYLLDNTSVALKKVQVRIHYHLLVSTLTFVLVAPVRLTNSVGSND